jgi:hypothetical protein
VLIAIPVPKNAQTAIKDLILKRGNPHKPCPLVQPLPNFVPKPTKNPANTNPGKVVHCAI